MKTSIHKLCLGLFLGIATLNTGSALGQIDYLETFDNDEHRWLTQDFETTNVAVCGPDYAYRANPVNSAGVTVPVESVSPSLGVSNGEIVTLSYSYKLLEYDNVLPYRAENAEDWGRMILQYGPTINGPWTDLDAITPFNHEPTADCQTRTVEFVPEEDTQVYLRVFADAGSSAEVNYFVYLDDISAFQQTLTVDPIFSRGDLTAYPNPTGNMLYIDYDGHIQDVAVFNLQGQAVVVEDMDDDFRRLNMEGLASGQYMLRIATDDQVRTVNIVKN